MRSLSTLATLLLGRAWKNYRANIRWCVNAMSSKLSNRIAFTTKATRIFGMIFKVDAGKNGTSYLAGMVLVTVKTMMPWNSSKVSEMF